MLLTNCL